MSALPARTLSESADIAAPAGPALALTPSTDQRPGRHISLQDLLSGRPLEITLKLVVSVELAEQPADVPRLVDAGRTGPALTDDERDGHDVLLTAEVYGRRHQPPRSAEWVRERCREGSIPGARKMGSAWYIPETALRPRGETDGEEVHAPTSRPANSPAKPTPVKRGITTEHPRW